MMMPEQCAPNACGPNACGPGYGPGPAAMGWGDVAGRGADPGPPMGSEVPPGGFAGPDARGGACGPADCGPGVGGPGGPPVAGGVNQIVIQIFYGDEPPEEPPAATREDVGGRYCGWRNWRNWRNA